MARIPAPYDLSSPGSLVSGRPIATIDTTSEGKGLQQLGSGLQDAGHDFGMLAKEQRQQTKLLQSTKSIADLDTARAARWQVAKDDTDYPTLRQRWDQADQKDIQTAASNISDPNSRNIFIEDARRSAVPYGGRISDAATAGVKDGQIATLANAWDQSAKIVADPTTPPEVRDRVKGDLLAGIDHGAQTGLYTQETANLYRQKYLQGGVYQQWNSFGDTASGNKTVFAGPPKMSATDAASSLQPFVVAGKPPETVTGMQPPLQTGLAAMLRDAPPDVRQVVQIQSGYRTPERQKELWDAAVQKYGSEAAARQWVAPPGHSEHNKGLAADLSYDGSGIGAGTTGAGKAAMDWVHAHAADYGLSFPLKNEPWHVEAAGARSGGDTTGSVPAMPLATDPTSVFGRMVQKESSGDPTALSPKGAQGLAQLMPDTARETAKSLGITLPAGDLGTYFATPEGQKVNLQLGQAYFQQQLKTFGGDTEAAVIAYNGGPGLAQKWIAEGRTDQALPKETIDYRNKVLKGTGGAGAPASAFTPRDDYSTAYHFYRTNAPELSAEQVSQLANQAVAKKNGFAVETRAGIEQASVDAPAAIQNNGTYTGTMPTAQDFAQAYGAEADKKYAQFQAQVETSKSIFDQRTLPNSDLQAIIARPAPTNTGEGAALDEAKYTAVRQAAAQTLKGRLEDPANAAMMAFPNVRQAWTDAGNDPTKMQAALTQMAAAQTQLGIPASQQVLLPQAAAKAQVEAFKNDAAPFQQRVSAVTGLVLRTRDPAQQQAVFQQLVKEGLPAETEGAIEAYSGGRTGDGDLLMQAALSDPAKLPGRLSATPAQIQQEIETSFGPAMDAAYGITLGTPANLQRAQNGSALAVKATQLRMAQGMDLQTAVKSAVGAMFGKDRQFLSQTADGMAASIAVPLGADPNVIRTRLPAAMPQITQALVDIGTKQADAVGADKPAVKAALQADAANHAQAVAVGGKWVNLAGGYAFVDPYTNRPVPGADGKPLIITDDQLAKMTGSASPAALTSQITLDTEAKPKPADPFQDAYDPTAQPPGGAGAVTPKAPELPPGVRIGPDGRKWVKNPEYETDPTVYPWKEVK